MTRAVGVVAGLTLIVVVWLAQGSEADGLKNIVQRALRELWVRAALNCENATRGLVTFSRGIATRILAVFDAFGPARSLRFAAAAACLSSVAFAICSLFSIVAEGATDARSVATLAKITGEVMVLLLYLKTSKTWLLGFFSVLCFFEVGTIHSPSATVAGVQVLLLKLSLFAPTYVFSLIYVPSSRAIARCAQCSRWAPVMVTAMICVPFLAAYFSIEILLAGVEARFAPFPLLDFYGAATASAVLLCLATCCLVNVTIFWRAALAAAWNVASRALQSLHDRGPERRHLYACGWMIIGLSLAVDPLGWILKSVGLPERPGPTQTLHPRDAVR